MSNDTKAAIRAIIAAIRAEQAAGQASPVLRQLTERAIAAAEKAAGIRNPGTLGSRSRG